MATVLTVKQKRDLEKGGALVLELPGLQTQAKGRYYNAYGEAIHGLPRDAWSLEHYLLRGLTLHKPTHPKKRPAPTVGVSDSNAKYTGPLNDGEGPAAVATYWTKEGTALPNLPADPANMAAYLAAGLSLDPPEAQPAPTPIRAPRSRRKAATA